MLPVCNALILSSFIIPGVQSVPVPKQYNAMKQHNARPAVYKMAAAGQSWSDDSLHDWPDDDHRIFVGDLGNECNDDLLAQAFSQYASFQKAKVRANVVLGAVSL